MTSLTQQQICDKQAQVALSVLTARFPEIEILIWEAGPQLIFIEYKHRDGFKIARAHINYEGNLI